MSHIWKIKIHAKEFNYVIPYAQYMSLESVLIGLGAASIPIIAAGIGYKLSIGETKRRDSRAILAELNDISVAITTPEDIYEDVMPENIKGKVEYVKILYNKVDIAMISFTGVVSAGHLSYFDDIFRNKLRKFYADIEAHNKTYTRMIVLHEEIVFKYNAQQYISLILPYAKTLTIIDKKINDKIQELIKDADFRSYTH